MKKPIIINGESWCHALTGIERLAIEVTCAFDKMACPGEMELVLPKNAKNIPELKNIKVVVLDYEAKSFPRWTQLVFQKYVMSRRGISLNYSNTCPFFVPGIEFLHDIYCRLFPEDFVSRRDKLVRLYSNLMYRAIAKRAKKIVTVSEYTKSTIAKTYHVDPKRISVVYSGVSGYKNIAPDFSVFDRISALKQVLESGRGFYFTLGSLSTRKNLKWIARHAEIFPDDFFVVTGKALVNVVPPELEKMRSLPNIILPGYLADGEVKAILAKCRAFVFPSYFEGFGLPPLEALSCGAQIIVSNKTSLPEIYGNCAHYIDPDNPNVDLAKLLSEPVEDASAILEKFTLENTAKRLFAVIQEVWRE